MFSATMNRVFRKILRPLPLYFFEGFQPLFPALRQAPKSSAVKDASSGKHGLWSSCATGVRLRSPVLFKPRGLFEDTGGSKLPPVAHRQIPSRQSPKGRSRQGSRPATEALEVRMLLSAIAITNTLDDGSQGSLRWAIDQANSNPGPETISFDPTVFATPQTITLTAGHLNLSNAQGITINGPAAGVSISGNNASMVFDVYLGTTATLTGLTITNGSGTGSNLDYSGGLFNLGTTTLIGCNVVGNTLTAFGQAGGLTNDGTMSLIGCNVSGNTIAVSGLAAGVYNNGTMSVLNSTISNNSAPFLAGVSNWGTITLTNSTICGNVSTRSTGGIGGMGSYGSGLVTMTNCTISNNTAHGSGNGANGGFTNYQNSQATLTNTIVAGNIGVDIQNFVFLNTDTANIAGSNNLLGTGSTPLINGVNGNIVGVTNPLLAPLGNFGGSTRTMALLPGSPAINAGTSGTGAPSTDQRGLSRVGPVDIGAFESQGFKFAAVSGTPQKANIGTTFAKPLVLSVSANNPLEPVNGGVVSFVAVPASNGASANLQNSLVTISGGKVTNIAATNNILGSYSVLASSGAGNTPTAFSLTNTGHVLSSLVVNTTMDSLVPGFGLFSLREAVQFANTNSTGASLITFDPKVFSKPQTITLTNGQLELAHGNDTMIGTPAGVTISGGGISRVFQIDSNVTASISHLTITQGHAVGDGGGLENFGHLTLDHITINGSTASNVGGGLASGGQSATLKVDHSTFSGNSAFEGGSIANVNHSIATITDSVINNSHASYGGGVFNNATITLSYSTLSGNSAAFGGGIRNDAPGSMTVSFSNIDGNSSTYGNGGGVSNSGTFNVDHSSILSNLAPNGQGGGIRSFGGTVTVVNTTLYGNSANGGGGFSFSNSSGTLTNCTLSGNTASDDSAALITSQSNVTLINTILAGNTDFHGNPSEIGQFSNVVGTNNLIGLGGSGGLTNGVAGNIVGVSNPLLGTLGFYGGPTETVPLLLGSPALNAGINGKGIPMNDQRGLCRMCGIDIGAFQSQGFTMTVVPSSLAQSTPVGQAFSNPLTVIVRANNSLEPVNGGVINFSAQTTKKGASATLSNSSAVISGGKASVNATANNNVGLYTVVANGGKSNTVLFVLNNANHPVK